MLISNILQVFSRQDYLRFGVRDKLIRLFHNPDTARSEYFDVDFFGFRYPGEFNCFIDWNVYYFGAYVKEELMLMKDILTVLDNPITLDIGANIGHHALFASKYSKKVYAFEPYYTVAKKLQEKIQINNITNIIFCPVGLGRFDRSLEYKIPNSNNTGTGAFQPEEIHKKSKDNIELQVLNGDNYLSSLNIPKLDFVKMDIEGFEIYALQGLEKTLQKFRPIVFFEWSKETKKALADLNFKKLFPENYSFYEFLPNISLWIVFRKLHYRLRLINEISKVPTGDAKMLLAFPQEFIEREQNFFLENTI